MKYIFRLTTRLADFIINIDRSLTIRKRLILFFSCLIVLPLVTFSIISYGSFSRYLESMAVVHKLDAVRSAIEGIGIIKDRDEKIAEQLLTNLDIQEALLKVPGSFGDDYETMQYFIKINSILSNMVDSYNVNRIFLLSEEGVVYKSNVDIMKVEETEEYKRLTGNEKFMKSRGENMWVPLNINIFESPYEELTYDKPFLYILKNVNSVRSAGTKIGTAVIQCKYERFESILKRISSRKGEYGILIDENGMILSHTTDKSMLGKPVDAAVIENIAGKNDGYFYINDSGQRYMILFSGIGAGGWTLIQGTPYKSVIEKSLEYRNITIVVMAACLIAALGISILFSNNITNPIVKLKNTMYRFGIGNLQVRSGSDRKDEIGQLQKTFDDMAEEIRNLLNRVEEEHKHSRKLELSVLEYQINPHFLYNTLDSINWMAQECGHANIGEMVTALARFFRIGLNKGKEYIDIKQEMEHAGCYLTIYKMRYGNCFNYSFDVEDSILDNKTIKIILQPIIENSIKHGIDKDARDGLITVTGRLEAGVVVLAVKDNGRGILPEKLQSIRQALAKDWDSEEDTGGIGLLNVNRRLKISFGQSYGIDIASQPGKGTEVYIKFPPV